MPEEPQKDWSRANELYKKAKEKARTEMSPEELQQALAEDEIGKKMRGEISAKVKMAEQEELKKSEKISGQKNNLDKMYAENKPKASKKNIADMIAEAEVQNEQLRQEALKEHEEYIERLSKMPINERIDYVQRKREQARKKRMGKLFKELGENENE